MIPIRFSALPSAPLVARERLGKGRRADSWLEVYDHKRPQQVIRWLQAMEIKQKTQNYSKGS